MPSADAAQSPVRKELCAGAEARLVARAQGDDAQALDMLIRAHKDKVFGLAYRLALADREAAMDLTQDILLRLARNIKSFKGKSSFSTWLYRIAINTWMSTRRREDRWTRMFRSLHPARPAPGESRAGDIPDHSSDPARIVSNRLFLRDLRETVQRLPAKQQLVFQLKTLQGMSVPEIAEITGMAQGTIKAHLFRATRKVREHLDEWVEP